MLIPRGFPAGDLDAPGRAGGGPRLPGRGQRSGRFETRQSLDQLVRAFHQAKLQDEWMYLFPDGVSRRVRRPSGPKRLQMLVAYR